MKRFLILILVLLPLRAVGQYSPYAPPNMQRNMRPDSRDPHVKRAFRERAFAYAGSTPEAREFIEKYGDLAVAAIYPCSPAGAAKLVEFYASGDLEKLPRFHDLLASIAKPRHGDAVVYWASQHVTELMDAENMDAFLQAPLEIALSLKLLDQAVADARSQRMTLEATVPSGQTLHFTITKQMIWIAGIVSIVALLIWRKRRRASGF